MPKFSAHLTQLFTERPFAERFAAAAAHGFVACEFRSPYEHRPEDVAAWSRDAALPVVHFNAPAGDWVAGDRGLAAVPGREAEFAASLDEALRYADALGTPLLHVMAGRMPAGADAEACHATFVSNLHIAARRLAAAGRTLLIEPLNPHDNPGYFLSTQAQAHAIRDEVGEPNLFVQFDCYHVAMTEGDVTAALAAGIGAMGHVQIAGAPGRHEPDTGELDYAPLLARLDALGYAGWVGCEYVPRAVTEAGLGWMATLGATPAPALDRAGAT